MRAFILLGLMILAESISPESTEAYGFALGVFLVLGTVMDVGDFMLKAFRGL
mgnify:CR=1 FL=1